MGLLRSAQILKIKPKRKKEAYPYTRGITFSKTSWHYHHFTDKTVIQYRVGIGYYAIEWEVSFFIVQHKVGRLASLFHMSQSPFLSPNFVTQCSEMGASAAHAHTQTGAATQTAADSLDAHFSLGGRQRRLFLEVSEFNKRRFYPLQGATEIAVTVRIKKEKDPANWENWWAQRLVGSSRFAHYCLRWVASLRYWERVAEAGAWIGAESPGCFVFA